MTRERISRILELREIFLSFQTGFNLVTAAVVCAILAMPLMLRTPFTPNCIQRAVTEVFHTD